MNHASRRPYESQAAITRRTHEASSQQQIRERLELRALGLGAPFDLAQTAADRWLRLRLQEVVL